MSEPHLGSCEEIVGRLNDYLDKELDEESMALVRAHLTACKVCSGGAAFEGTVLNAVKEKLRQTALPEDLKRRVFDRLRSIEEAGE